jgi:Do/DeqQ family serine protease
MRRPILLLFVLLAITSCNRDRGRDDYKLPPATTTPVTRAQNLQSFAEVVDKCTPAVVTIRSERRVRPPRQFPFMDDSFLRRFFGEEFGSRMQRPRVQRGLGSGVLVTKEGYILTNHHVVDGAEDIRVELATRRVFEAQLIGSDAPSDLAVLKIQGGDHPVLNLGNSDEVRVGDVCLAIGNPLGIGMTVTAGIISAKNRSTGLSDGSFEDFLQTDAPINQGNSGGALVNSAGQLIGINSQIVSTSGGNIGIGFAIPSNMARTVMDQLVKGGRVRRGQLGVTIQEMSPDLANGLGLPPETQGILLGSVTPGSPAARAGLKPGDVITAIDGNPIGSDTNAFRNRVASAGPGAKMTFTVRREKGEQQVQVTLGEFADRAALEREGQEDRQTSAEGSRLGIAVEPLTADIARQLGIRAAEGLLVTAVDPGGPASEARLAQGDVILQINRQAVRSAADLRAALARNKGKPSVLLINRRGQSAFVTVTPE